MHKQKNEKILGFHLQFCGCWSAGSKKALTQSGERRGGEQRGGRNIKAAAERKVMICSPCLYN